MQSKQKDEEGILSFMEYITEPDLVLVLLEQIGTLDFDFCTIIASWMS